MISKYAIINIEVLEKRIEELEEMSKHNQQVGEYDSEGEIISEIKEILSNTISLEKELEILLLKSLDSEEK